MLPFSVPQRWQKPLEILGYTAAAVVIAVVTLYASLSRDRIKDALETALSADPMSSQPLGLGMDVSIGEVGLTLFGPGVELKDIVLRSRPLNPNDKPTRVLVDRVVVRFGVWGMLTGHPSYTFRGEAFGGTVRGRLSFDPRLSDIELHADKIAVGDAQALLATSIKLPVTGQLNANLELHLAKGLLADAKGSLDVTLSDGAIGDGKAKLVIPNDPMMSQGLTLPRIKLGQLDGKATLEGGKAQLGEWRLHSADVDAVVEGTIELRDPWMLSQLRGFLRWRASEALIKRESIVELLVSSAPQSAKRADGWLGYQLAGSLGSPALVPNTTGPGPTAPPPSLPHPPPPTPQHNDPPHTDSPPAPPVVVVQPAPEKPADPPPAAPAAPAQPATTAPATGAAVPAPGAASAANPAGLPTPPVANSVQPGRHAPTDTEHEVLVAPEPQNAPPPSPPTTEAH